MVSLGVLAYFATASRLLQPQGTGRFQPSSWPQPPGFTISSTGFKVRGSPGDPFQFLSPLPSPTLVLASPDLGKYSFASHEYAPSAIEVDLPAPGFSLTFPRGFQLRFTSSDSPRLTTSEVTVDAPNPTPPTKWLLVTFVETQVPVLLVFDHPISAALTGTAGDWRLQTSERYHGDVFVRLPLGTVKLKSQVADLGAAVHLLDEQKQFWLTPPAHLIQTSYSKADGGVKVTWNFDRPFALVPPFLLFQDSKSGIAMGREFELSNADLDEGPQAFTKSSTLTVFLPERPLPNSEPLLDTDKPLAVAPFMPLPSTPIETGDYFSGMIGGPPGPVSLKATMDVVNQALSRVAPEDIGRSALMNAALAGWPRLQDYRADHGFDTPIVPLVDPLAALRSTVFGALSQVGPEELALRSPARLSGAGTYTCLPVAEGYRLTWVPSKPGDPLALATPWPVDVTDAKGVMRLEPKPGKDWFTFTITPSGSEAQVTLKLPQGQKLPKKA